MDFTFQNKNKNIDIYFPKICLRLLKRCSWSRGSNKRRWYTPLLIKKLTKSIKSAVLRSSFAIWNEKEFRVQRDRCQTSSKDVSLKYDFLAQSNHVSWYSNVHLIPQILCFKRQFSIAYSPKSNIKQARRAESFGSAHKLKKMSWAGNFNLASWAELSFSEIKSS